MFVRGYGKRPWAEFAADAPLSEKARADLVRAALVEELNEDIGEMDKLITQALLLARSLGHQEPEETDVNQLLAQIAQDFQRAGNDVRFLLAQGHQAADPTSCQECDQQ